MAIRFKQCSGGATTTPVTGDGFPLQRSTAPGDGTDYYVDYQDLKDNILLQGDSLITVLTPTATGYTIVGLDDLTDVYANTVAGDVVTVYPGTYELGDGVIERVAGVHWNFIGRPRINSTAPALFTGNAGTVGLSIGEVEWYSDGTDYGGGFVDLVRYSDIYNLSESGNNSGASHNLAVGTSAKAIGGFISVAYGQNAIADSGHAFAFGNGAESHGSSSFALGTWSVVNGDDSVIFGTGTVTEDDVFSIMGKNFGVGTVAPTSPMQVVGIPVYANNTAALAGGLTAGAFYRTGADPDPLMIVH